MKNIRKKIERIILVFILAFLIIPISGRAGIDLSGDVNDGDGENVNISPLEKEEVDRYINSIDQITKVVSNSILILPKLDMIGGEAMTVILTKISNYNNFINDYTQDIEQDGASLFSDLIDGYRATRKVFYLAKSINNLALSVQSAYELVNSSENFLEENKELILDSDDLQDSVDDYKIDLEDNSLFLEDFIQSIADNVRIELGFYEEDINNLTSLREVLEENIDFHLQLSTEIIDTCEEIISSVSEEGSDHGESE